MAKAGKKQQPRSRVPPQITLAEVQQKINGRKFHREREFQKTAKYTFYQQAIAQRLGRLMTKKKKVNAEFVRQYYTQHIIYHGRVDLRGKKIVINADKINQHYNLPRISDDDCMYQKLTANQEAFPYADIAKEIVINGENTWFVRFSQKKYIARSDLTPEAKCWLHLVANNIKPTTHLTYISGKLALIIFLLKTRQPVNLGNIMYNALYKCREKHYKSLIFPHFITSFFLQAKVEQLPTDPLIEPDRPFTYTNLGSQLNPEHRQKKRVRHEGPRSKLDLQFEAITDRIDRLENTLSTAISQLTSLVTRLAYHQGLPINVLALPSADVHEANDTGVGKENAQPHCGMTGTDNGDEDQQDEGDDDDIRSTDAEVSASDDEEMGETGSSSRRATSEQSDSEYEPSDPDDC